MTIRPNTNQRSNPIPVDKEHEAAIVLAYSLGSDGNPTPVAAAGLDSRDTNNEQTAPLLAGQTFTGEWTKIDHLGHFQVLYAAIAPIASVAIEWSNDGVNALGGDFGSSAQVVQVISGYNVVYYVGDNNNIAPYYRLKVVNGASDQTAYPNLISIAWLNSNPYNGAWGLLTATLNNLSRALLTRSVIAGIQPDGDFVNERADGIAVTEDDTDGLGSGGVFESDWIDTDGWASVELFIHTDQVSATDGIEIEYTDDVEAVTPVIRATRLFTFTAADAARGFATYRFPAELDGMRIRFTNGGTPSSQFFLAATLRTQSTNPQSSLEAQLNATNLALMIRGVIAAANDLGTYGNITRGDLGGLRVAVNEFEAEAPIKALNNFQTNQANVTASATQIVGSPLTGRKTVAIKALASNNAKVYIGLSGVTTGSGWELNASESIVMEIDATAPGIYAIAASGTQRVCWAEVA